MRAERIRRRHGHWHRWYQRKHIWRSVAGYAFLVLLFIALAYLVSQCGAGWVTRR